MHQQIYLRHSLAGGHELVEHLGVAILARVQVHALLILQRVQDRPLDELFA